MVIVGGLIGGGIVLSIYANQVLFEGLTKGDGKVSLGNDLVISVELDPAKSETGVYDVKCKKKGHYFGKIL